MKPCTTLIMLFILLGMLPTAPAADDDRADLTPWRFTGYWELEEIPEPSGMCFVPERNTLFIVDDGSIDRRAAVFEVSLEPRVLNRYELGVDLEGICWHPGLGRLYVCDEYEHMLYELSPELQELRSLQVVANIDGVQLLHPGGNGFEGIEFVPEIDSFVLLNQDDPTCLLVVTAADLMAGFESGSVSEYDFIELEQVNAGELHYAVAEEELWVVHAWVNVMQVWGIEPLELKRWEVVPGAAQEAVAIDDEGRLWIGYDLGGLSCYQHMPSD
jgi:hypothetical protein